MGLPPLHRLVVAPASGTQVGAPDGVPGDGAANAKLRKVERQETELSSLVSLIKSGVTGVDRVSGLRAAKQLYREMVRQSLAVVLDDDVNNLAQYLEAEWTRTIESTLEGVAAASEATMGRNVELRVVISALLEDTSLLSQAQLDALVRARAELDRIVLEMDTQPEQKANLDKPPSSAADTPPSATETPSSTTNGVGAGDALDGGGGGADDREEFAELGDVADDDDYDPLGRIAGRAAMKFHGKKFEYFLVVWTGYDIAETAEWLKESEFDTPRRKALLAAYKLQTGGEDDPQGLGWVRRVIEDRERGRGRGSYKEYKIMWLMDNDIPIIERLLDWVRRSELVSPTAVLGRDAVGRVDGAGAAAGDDEGADPGELDSDGEEDGEENATGRRTRRGALPPEAGMKDDADMLSGDSSSTLVWDAGSQRAKVSIARTIATLENEEPWCEQLTRTMQNCTILHNPTPILHI